MEIPASFFNVSFNKAMAFGYKTDDVDQFVTQALHHIKDLQEENESLLEKLNVLASNLSQYREEEDSLRSALVGAQKLGDSILKDSRNKAEMIMRDATTRADKVTEQAALKLERQQHEYDRLKNAAADFKDKLFMLYRSHLDMINNIPASQPEEERAAPAHAPAASEEEYHSAFVQEDAEQDSTDEVQQKLDYLDQLSEAHNEEFEQAEPPDELPEELPDELPDEPARLTPAAIPEDEPVEMFDEPQREPDRHVTVAIGAPEQEPDEDLLVYAPPAKPRVIPPRRNADQARPYTPPAMVQMEFSDGSLAETDDELDVGTKRTHHGESIKVPYFDDEDDESGEFESQPAGTKKHVVSQKFGVLKFGDAFDLTDD